MNHVPPFEKFKELMTFSNVQGELTARMTYADFRSLIRGLLGTVDVDEELYLNQYPDVTEEIRKGTIKSPKDHFLSSGYFEGRLPFPIPVDEAWYLEQNPGVAKAIARGTLKSAQQHFNDSGYREGRLPSPPRPGAGSVAAGISPTPTRRVR